MITINLDKIQYHITECEGTMICPDCGREIYIDYDLEYTECNCGSQFVLGIAIYKKIEVVYKKY
jgi:hypothetical protein